MPDMIIHAAVNASEVGKEPLDPLSSM